MTNVLFVCSQNLIRSVTAEDLFISWPDINVASAGTNHDAATPLTADLVESADIIIVMQNIHRQKLNARFKSLLRNKKVVSLDIPDIYTYMDPELVKILNTVVPKHLPQRPQNSSP